MVDDTELRVAVKDVFNSRPRVDVREVDNAYMSPIGEPRLRTLQISVRTNF